MTRFGDKKIKALDTSLEAGWRSLGLGVQRGNLRDVVTSVGSDLVGVSRALSSDGRATDARNRLLDAKRPSLGRDVAAVWNELLDTVASQTVQPSAPSTPRRTEKRR